MGIAIGIIGAVFALTFSYRYLLSNPEKCDTLRDSDTCYSHLAQSTHNESLCKKLSQLRYQDNCILTIAIKDKNKNLCLEMNDKLRREECKSKMEQGMFRYGDYQFFP